jgi:hypothetical protein
VYGFTQHVRELQQALEPARAFAEAEPFSQRLDDHPLMPLQNTAKVSRTAGAGVNLALLGGPLAHFTNLG